MRPLAMKLWVCSTSRSNTRARPVMRSTSTTMSYPQLSSKTVIPGSTESARVAGSELDSRSVPPLIPNRPFITMTPFRASASRVAVCMRVAISLNTVSYRQLRGELA